MQKKNDLYKEYVKVLENGYKKIWDVFISYSYDEREKIIDNIYKIVAPIIKRI